MGSNGIEENSSTQKRKCGDVISGRAAEDLESLMTLVCDSCPSDVTVFICVHQILLASFVSHIPGPCRMCS